MVEWLSKRMGGKGEVWKGEEVVLCNRSSAHHTRAACKLHLIFSVLGKSEQKITLTAERRRESRVFGVGAWVRGRLLLFDLGYFKYPLFDRISHFGGYFISRLKGPCNPLIVAENIACRGRKRELVGKNSNTSCPA